MTDLMPIPEPVPITNGLNLSIFIPILVRVGVFVLSAIFGLEAAKAQELATQIAGVTVSAVAVVLTVIQAYKSRVKLLNTPPPAPKATS